MRFSKNDTLQNGKYVIIEKLGEGYFGITYKAKNTSSPNKFVAIKIPSYYDNPSSPKQCSFNEELDKVFKKEVESLDSILNHENPHIVKFFQTFYENNVPCIVMEFVKGQSLEKLVKDNGALSEQDAIRYIKQVGEGLIFLHGKNLTHRDVQPENILINEEGKAILIDFGLARDSKSLYHYVLPTYAHQRYAPPEQSKGSRQPRVDVYSLSASLYRAITAQDLPCDHKLETWELEESLDKKISTKLRQAILMGMQLEAENRPQSMQAWLELLLTTSSTNNRFSTNRASKAKYSRLRDLLEAKKWKEADEETLAIMLKAIGRENEDRPSRKYINELSRDDLDAINKLWTRCSDGYFGFSVQKSLWKSVDCDCKNFRVRVGWKKFARFNIQETYANGYFPVLFVQKRMWIPDVGKGWVKGIWVYLWIIICVATYGLAFLLWIGFMFYFKAREYNEDVISYILEKRI